MVCKWRMANGDSQAAPRSSLNCHSIIESSAQDSLLVLLRESCHSLAWNGMAKLPLVNCTQTARCAVGWRVAEAEAKQEHSLALRATAETAKAA